MVVREVQMVRQYWTCWRREHKGGGVVRECSFTLTPFLRFPSIATDGLCWRVVVMMPTMPVSTDDCEDQL